jgi:hypothetical protein
MAVACALDHALLDGGQPGHPDSVALVSFQGASQGLQYEHTRHKNGCRGRDYPPKRHGVDARSDRLAS